MVIGEPSPPVTFPSKVKILPKPLDQSNWVMVSVVGGAPPPSPRGIGVPPPPARSVPPAKVPLSAAPIVQQMRTIPVQRDSDIETLLAMMLEKLARARFTTLRRNLANEAGRQRESARKALPVATRERRAK